MIVGAGRCVFVWIYSLVRARFRVEDLNGGQWPVRIIMGVLGAAEVLAEQILKPLALSRRRALQSTCIYSALFSTVLFGPSFCLITKDL